MISAVYEVLSELAVLGARNRFARIAGSCPRAEMHEMHMKARCQPSRRSEMQLLHLNAAAVSLTTPAVLDAEVQVLVLRIRQGIDARPEPRPLLRQFATPSWREPPAVTIMRDCVDASCNSRPQYVL